MPMVNGKKYPYTEKGKADARKAIQRDKAGKNNWNETVSSKRDKETGEWVDVPGTLLRPPPNFGPEGRIRGDSIAREQMRRDKAKDSKKRAKRAALKAAMKGKSPKKGY